MKRILAFFLSIFVALECPIDVYAGAKVMPDGRIFDPDLYYSTSASDLSDIDNEEDLYASYKKSNSLYGYKGSALQIGQYSDAAYFMDNVSLLDGVSYGIKQWKYALKAGFGNILKSRDAVAKDFMKDEYKTRELLAEVVDDIFNTEVETNNNKSYASLTNKTFKVAKMFEKNSMYHQWVTDNNTKREDVFANPLMEKMISKVGDDVYKEKYKNNNDAINFITSSVQNIYDSCEDVQKLMNNYEMNLRMLDAVESTAPDSTLRDAIHSLQDEYSNAYVNATKDIFSNVLNEFMSIAEFTEGSDFSIGNIGYSDLVKLALDDNDKIVNLGDIAAKYMLGKGFSTGTAIVDVILAVTGESKKASKIDKVIISSYLRTDAINSLRLAEERYIKNQADDEAFKNFYYSYLLAKGLTAIQYKNMSEYYKEAGKNDLANSISSKFNEINSLTPLTYLDKLNNELEQNKNKEWSNPNSNSNNSEKMMGMVESGDLSDCLGFTMGQVKKAFPGGTMYSDLSTSIVDWKSRSPYELDAILIPSNDDVPYYLKDGIVFASVDNTISYITLDNYNEYSIYGLKPYYSPEKVKSIMSSNGWTFDGTDKYHFEGLPGAESYYFSNNGRSIEYEYVYEDEDTGFLFFEEDSVKNIEYSYDSKTKQHIIACTIYYYYDWVFNEWE